MPDKSLLQKITEAQLVVENPKLDKSAQYGKYSSLKECFRVVNTACAPLGLSVYHDIEDTDTGYLVSTVITDGNETVKRSPFPANFGTKPQTNGSELTYAKRYSLCAAFGIVGDDDDDGQAAQDAPRNTRPPKRQAPEPKPADNDPLMVAKGRLKIAIQKYAELHGGDDKAMMAGITKRPDYKTNATNPEWFDLVASEFEAA